MTEQLAQVPSHRSLTALSRLLLAQDSDISSLPGSSELMSELLQLSREEFDELVDLAQLNHVVVRGLDTFLQMMLTAGDDRRAEWAQVALDAERNRIGTAVAFLQEICNVCEADGQNIAVIKSLDHWPDLGSDLDLYTDATPKVIGSIIGSHFHAQLAPRSWGDRLACKWNFLIPGLPESVEVHMGRLGQTGEQVAIASSLMARSRVIQVDGRDFRVTSISDRLMISTLQRMYRHFYFRLCDIVDSASLVDAGAVDFADLRASATNAGIWEGVAAYLVIVSDYVKKYRGIGIDLPQYVRAAARFGGEVVYFARGFIRVPIMPQSAGLYGTQLAGMFRKFELHNGARLSLLPWLATAAVVGQKITGSDKGIW